MTAPSVTCESVRKASIRDGLVYHGTTLRTAHPRVGHYAALFIWPNRDYHWIRKVFRFSKHFLSNCFLLGCKWILVS